MCASTSCTGGCQSWGKTSVDDQPLRNILRRCSLGLWETCAASCVQRVLNVARQHPLKSVYMHQWDVLSFELAKTNHGNLPQVPRRMNKHKFNCRRPTAMNILIRRWTQISVWQGGGFEGAPTLSHSPHLGSLSRNPLCCCLHRSCSLAHRTCARS